MRGNCLASLVWLHTTIFDVRFDALQSRSHCTSALFQYHQHPFIFSFCYLFSSQFIVFLASFLKKNDCSLNCKLLHVDGIGSFVALGDLKGNLSSLAKLFVFQLVIALPCCLSVVFSDSRLRFEATCQPLTRNK